VGPVGPGVPVGPGSGEVLKDPPKKMPDTPKGTPDPKVKTPAPVPPGEVRINDAPPAIVPAPAAPRIEVAPQAAPGVNDPRPPF